MSDEAPETVSVPIPRPVAWLVGRVGWGGALAIVLAANALGWTDTLFALAGLPPLMGADDKPELVVAPTSDACQGLAIRLAEIHGEISAETGHARAVRAQILERLSERPRGR